MSTIKSIANSIIKLSDEALNDLENIFSSRNCKKGEIVAKAGEKQKSIFILKNGIVRGYELDKKGKVHIRSIFTSGSIFCSLTSLILKAPTNSTYDCITDCSLMVASWEQFTLLTKKYHDIALLHIKNLENAFVRIEGRVTSLSTLNATERYKELKKKFPTLENQIPLHQIAAYLNITSVQLSRIRKEIYSK